MNPDVAFERSLEALFEAALDDTRWPTATALIEEAVGFQGNALIVGQGEDGSARVLFARFLEQGNCRDEMGRMYFDGYYRKDEAVPRIRLLPHGQLVHAPDLYTEEERKTSPTFNECMRFSYNQNGLFTRFDGPDEQRIIWHLGNPLGGRDWQSDRLRLLERLLPNVHRCILIRQSLAAADALGAGLAGLLDNDRIAAVHLDRTGRMLEANTPALEILRRGDGLSDAGGMLSASAPGDDERLQALLQCALPRVWSEPPTAGAMMLGRPSGAAPLRLHVCPVGDMAADFGGPRVAALVLAVDPARRPHINHALVATAFGLSPSEGRTAALLAEGRPVREIAAVTGWQESYVRRLLKRIYRKLGVSGQVSLMSRVLALGALPRD